jgi:hypothetical protein
MLIRNIFVATLSAAVIYNVYPNSVVNAFSGFKSRHFCTSPILTVIEKIISLVEQNSMNS